VIEALQTNAADEAQITRARRKVKDRRRREHALMAQQLSTYDGREFVWRELERHGIYREIGGTTDAVFTALGRRSAGLELLADVMSHPQQYLLMQNEAMVRAERESKDNQAARTAAAGEHV
jgi:hypothetical protein